MEWVLIIQIVLFFMFVFYLINNYRDKNISWLIILMIYITWCLTFCVVIILPIDIYDTLINKQTENVQLQNTWTTFYWSLMSLTFLILPIMREYMQRGEFNSDQKLKRSIWSVIQYYLIILIPIIILLIYLQIAYEKGFLARIIPIIKALGQIWGMSVMILLMGYGIVAIPKSYWRGGDNYIMMNYYYFVLTELNEERESNHFNFSQKIKLIHTIRQRLNQANKLYEAQLIQKIIDTIPSKLYIHHSSNINQSDIKYEMDNYTNKDLSEISEQDIIDLNRLMKQLMGQAKRSEWVYEYHIQKSFELQEILQSQGQMKIVSKFRKERTYLFGNTVDYLEYMWLLKIKPILKRVFVFVFIFISLIIIVGEISIFVGYRLDIKQYLIHQNQYLTQTLVLLPMLLMAFIVNYGFFRLKLNGLTLNDNNQTDGASLIFSAVNFSRVSFPLTINYLQVIDIDNTQFNKLFKQQRNFDLKEFDEGIKILFPALLIIFIILNYFDVFSKFLNCLGLSQFQFAKSFSDDKIEDGKELLEKIRKLKEKIYYDNERVRQGLKVGYKARYRTRYFGDDDLFYDEFEFKNSYKHF